MIWCDYDDFKSGSDMSIWEDDFYEVEEQLYAQMLGWA